jgi:2-polyprenyl-3-methyl-5-hydroxy-6-metoxy-1,4-benzoquinol methylase
MISAKAQEIIDRAMSDRAVYDAMAARENEVWGKILPAIAQSEAAAVDAKASASLKAGRHQASLVQIAKQMALTFEKGLTLGCGAGRLERHLLASRICRSFHGIDISENAILEAKTTAARESLPITYEISDLNFLSLPKATFDLVAAQTALHHVLFLEHVAEQVWQTLTPGGYLWIHDFIGETQGQYDPERLALINRLLALLPEKLRTNHISKRTVAKIETPEPGKLGSPFEKIRSEEIVGIFERWFTIEWKGEFNAFLHLVAPPGTRIGYDENEDTRALFETLVLLDEFCIAHGILRPTGGQYLMKPRPVPLAAVRSD